MEECSVQRFRFKVLPAGHQTQHDGNPGTTGTVIFRAKILDDYRTKPFTWCTDVVEGDVMTDTASMTAAALPIAMLTPTGSTVTWLTEIFSLANGGSTKETLCDQWIVSYWRSAGRAG